MTGDWSKRSGDTGVSGIRVSIILYYTARTVRYVRDCGSGEVVGCEPARNSQAPEIKEPSRRGHPCLALDGLPRLQHNSNLSRDKQR